MALLMAARRATLSSAFLGRVLSRRGTTASSAAAPLANRRNFSYFSSPIIDSNEDCGTINAHGGSYDRTEQFALNGGILDDRMENPFQKSGAKGAFEAKKVEGGLYLRMEMPGISKDDMKVWVEYDSVYVKGGGRKEHPYENSGRTYDANIELPANCLQANKIDAEMKNGVLRMVIPRAEPFQGPTRSRRTEIEVK